MQPYYEALTLEQQPLGSRHIPSVVTQIADGENGGVMMNEFPEAFLQAHRKARQQNPVGEGHTQTVAINGSEWLELLEQAGVTATDFPEVQAVQQHRLWQQVGSDSNRETVNAAIEELKANNNGFSMEGPLGPTTSVGLRGTTTFWSRWTNSAQPFINVSTSRQKKIHRSRRMRDIKKHFCICFYWKQAAFAIGAKARGLSTPATFTAEGRLCWTDAPNELIANRKPCNTDVAGLSCPLKQHIHRKYKIQCQKMLDRLMLIKHSFSA